MNLSHYLTLETPRGRDGGREERGGGRREGEEGMEGGERGREGGREGGGREGGERERESSNYTNILITNRCWTSTDYKSFSKWR